MSENTATNPATEHVSQRQESPVGSYVADHGRGVTDVEQTTIAGRRVTVATSLTDAERDMVADVIRGVDPTDKTCFANALRAWEHESAFDYVEGWATADDIGFVLEHAWNRLHGKLVDVTTIFDAYHGATITDDAVLATYSEIGREEDVWGVLRNHADRHAFLRDRGYL